MEMEIPTTKVGWVTHDAARDDGEEEDGGEGARQQGKFLVSSLVILALETRFQALESAYPKGSLAFGHRPRPRPIAGRNGGGVQPVTARRATAAGLSCRQNPVVESAAHGAAPTEWFPQHP
ncbi:hypothetical protein ColTof3_05810 [Colletotrichum tofieldiae]|nr:hypothetical protein ColTof3_05810 [Colletotrichum tofieldiae]